MLCPPAQMISFYEEKNTPSFVLMEIILLGVYLKER